MIHIVLVELIDSFGEGTVGHIVIRHLMGFVMLRLWGVCGVAVCESLGVWKFGSYHVTSKSITHIVHHC